MFSRDFRERKNREQRTELSIVSTWPIDSQYSAPADQLLIDSEAAFHRLAPWLKARSDWNQGRQWHSVALVSQMAAQEEAGVGVDFGQKEPHFGDESRC